MQGQDENVNPGATPGAARPAEGPIIGRGSLPPETSDKELEKALHRHKIIEQAERLSARERAGWLAANGVSLQNFYRWRQRLAAEGMAGLVRRPRSDREIPRRLPPEAVELVRAKWLDPSRPSAKKVWRQVVQLWPEILKQPDFNTETTETTERKNLGVKTLAECFSSSELSAFGPSSGRGVRSVLKPPSYSSILKVLAEIPRPLAVLARRGKREYRDQCEPIILREKPALPNLWWNADHHQFDLFVLVPARHGPVQLEGRSYRPVRPWISAWSDVATNGIIGFTINTQPDSQEIALAWRHAVLPKAKEHLFCGLPDHVLIDNGKDYRSRYLDAVWSELSVQAHYAEAYHGQSKPLERLFRTLEEELIRGCMGWCGNSPKNRPEGLDPVALGNRNELMTLEEFSENIAHDLIFKYHHLASAGLDNKSPWQVYEEAMLSGWTPKTPRPEALDLLLMRQASRLVTRAGFTLLGRDGYYWSDALAPLVGRRVDVRYDPAALGTVKVFCKGDYLGDAVHRQRLEWGTGAPELKAAIAHRRSRLKTMLEDLENRRQIMAGISDLELVTEEKRIAGIEERAERLAVNAPAPVIQMLPAFESPRCRGGTVARWQGEERKTPNVKQKTAPPLSFGELYYLQKEKEDKT